MPQEKLRTARVPTELAGSRLDRALVELLHGPTRARVQEWIRDGRVRMDGDVVRRAGAPVAAGAQVTCELPEPPPRPTAEEARARLVVLHEDAELVAIDKPAGLLAHGDAEGAEPSVASLAAALYGELPEAQGADRPGIVHRLDRDTSGVMVLARTEAALEELMRQFRERETEKTYLALVHGEPRFDSEWIEAPIGRSPQRPDRMGVVAEGEGKEARTFYEVKERFGEFALLACRPVTGRTHQVRVHLSWAGHPLVGEPLYRRRNVPARPISKEAPNAARQMLHAAELKLVHPRSGEELVVSAALPHDMRAWLEWLRGRSR